jgi:hypothetical protein
VDRTYEESLSLKLRRFPHQAERNNGRVGDWGGDKYCWEHLDQFWNKSTQTRSQPGQSSALCQNLKVIANNAPQISVLIEELSVLQNVDYLEKVLGQIWSAVLHASLYYLGS